MKQKLLLLLRIADRLSRLEQFGGLAALSGGLIGPEIEPGNYEGSLEHTPVFLGCSDRDPHIPKERVDETEQVFQDFDVNVTKKFTKAWDTVNRDEIKAVQQMISDLMKS